MKLAIRPITTGLTLLLFFAAGKTRAAEVEVFVSAQIERLSTKPCTENDPYLEAEAQLQDEAEAVRHCKMTTLKSLALIGWDDAQPASCAVVDGTESLDKPLVQRSLSKYARFRCSGEKKFTISSFYPQATEALARSEIDRLAHAECAPSLAVALGQATLTWSGRTGHGFDSSPAGFTGRQDFECR